MDWITGIQKAIDYIESHILESIDYEIVAKQAYSSSFHFQRVFSILCGFTLGDYIRMRRLSLAGNDLSSSKIRVIDAAIKYGYDTSESFSRAFTRFHGVSPSQAKSGSVSLKLFSPICVKLILDGGNTLNYRIETRDNFNFICKKLKCSRNTNMPQDEISDFWKLCISDGTIDKLNKYIQSDNMFGDCIIGASFGKDATNAEFPYAIGTVYKGDLIVSGDLMIEEIPSHTYIVFTCVGKMPDAILILYHQIISEFFPTSEYQPCGGTDFESYPSANIENPNYTCEIWIAVEKK